MDYALIMAGGAGTRLWPLSREHLPKPALRLYGVQSMFEIAVERLLPLFSPEQILVVASADHNQVLREQVPSIPEGNFIVEPEGRGTASAIGLAAIHLEARDPEAVMAVLTADHVIGKPDIFRSVIRSAMAFADDDYLVTLGIKPTWPSTSYGYIEQAELLGEKLGFKAYTAERFVEKPNAQNAQRMLNLGIYSWNSGMFIWKVDRIMGEFKWQMPDLYARLMRIAETIGTEQYNTVLGELWPGLAKQTIDYGIMENAKRVIVLPADMDWLDVGTWNNLKTVLDSDDKGNSKSGDVVLWNSENSMVIGDKRLVAGIGLENMIIVDTPDALLVCDMARAGEVKALVEHLKQIGRQDLA
jgi:mannose-1-phosphate guanylyltransferase